MGKKPNISVTYENERISIKKRFPYRKCALHLSCVVHGPIYGHLKFLQLSKTLKCYFVTCFFFTKLDFIQRQCFFWTINLRFPSKMGMSQESELEAFISLHGECFSCVPCLLIMALKVALTAVNWWQYICGGKWKKLLAFTGEIPKRVHRVTIHAWAVVKLPSPGTQHLLQAKAFMKPLVKF